MFKKVNVINVILLKFVFPRYAFKMKSNLIHRHLSKNKDYYIIIILRVYSSIITYL